MRIASNFMISSLSKGVYAKVIPQLRQMSTSPPSLLIENVGNVVKLTLNRPKALNALDIDMCVEVRDMLLNWRRIGLKDPSTPGALIVKGAGGKAFCAGGDVKSIWQEIVNLHPQSVPVDDIYIGSGRPGKLASDFFRTEYQMNYLLGTSLVSQVSLWDGIVMGGGVGVSVLGDYRVATEKSLFAMPETAIGLFPDVGSSAWLPHLKSGFGNFIGLTGTRLKGPDLVYSGIATHFVNSDRLPELEAEIIRVTVPDPVESRQQIKAVLKKFKTEVNDDFLSQSLLKANEATISAIFKDAASIESIMAALMQESDKGNEFAKSTYETLAKHSPSSLKISLEQLRLGKDLDLKAGLEMEFRMMMKCMAGHDFREGIRAVLVDKDNKPMWKPATIQDVHEDTVQKYFQSLKEFELNLDFNVEQ